MMLFHDIKRDGYTVQQLHDHLGQAVAAGEGSRQVLIGPTAPDDPSRPDGATHALALSIVGIEANKDGEDDVYWLYPGDDEWI